jgi:hypothetical protein
MLVPIPLVLLPILPIQQPTRDCLLDTLTPFALEERARTNFDAAVHDYVGLHRRLARSIGALTVLDDEARLAGDELRVAVLAARPLAAPGDFFTPTVAEVFRARIDAVLLRGAAPPPGHLYRPLAGEPAPAVNQEFPLLGVSVEWPALVVELPALPRELGYAVWGRDLVLVDLPANLVLDVLTGALPEDARPGVQYD